MSVKVELRCDVGSDGPPGYAGPEPFCYSKRIRSEESDKEAEAVVENLRTKVVEAYDFVQEDAKRHGWKKTPADGWACPNCREWLKLPAAERLRSQQPHDRLVLQH
jgi:hypothetical protein